MKLGRVIGTVVASVKADGMKGLKLLVVRPLTADLRDAGIPFVATDASAQAGPGTLVTYEGIREAALLHDPWFIPVDHAIVGIVDQHVHEEPLPGAHEHGFSTAAARSAADALFSWSEQPGGAETSGEATAKGREAKR
jgi:ethanolamine utilization protein EutN